jgi:hypothetical protein
VICIKPPVKEREMPILSLFYGIIIHCEDLEANWKLLLNGEEYFKIDPLK